MSNYPTNIDDQTSLYNPANSFSTKLLITTLGAGCTSGDTSIQLAATVASLGGPAAYGVLSIDDELIVYTGSSGSTVSGCIRGSFGTTAAGHPYGATAKWRFVKEFVTAIQSAILAIENTLGANLSNIIVGSNKSLLFNDAGAMGGGTDLTWDKSAKVLGVVGEVKSGTGTPKIRLCNAAGGAGNLQMRMNVNASNVQDDNTLPSWAHVLGGASNDYWGIYRMPAGGSFVELMRLTSTGALGIGTASPFGKLSARPNTNKVISVEDALGLTGAVTLNVHNDAHSANTPLEIRSSLTRFTVASQVEFSGQIKVEGGTPGAGKVLTSDATGVGSWETPTGGSTATLLVSGGGSGSVGSTPTSIGIYTNSTGDLKLVMIAGQCKFSGMGSGKEARLSIKIGSTVYIPSGTNYLTNMTGGAEGGCSISFSFFENISDGNTVSVEVSCEAGVTGNFRLNYYAVGF